MVYRKALFIVVPPLQSYLTSTIGSHVQQRLSSPLPATVRAFIFCGENPSAVSSLLVLSRRNFARFLDPLRARNATSRVSRVFSRVFAFDECWSVGLNSARCDTTRTVSYAWYAIAGCGVRAETHECRGESDRLTDWKPGDRPLLTCCFEGLCIPYMS